jgi:NADPH2:quinone reductase
VRRVTVRAFGGPEQLTVETVAEAPRVGPGQLLVEVEASGINYLDVYQRNGTFKLPPPCTPGYEGVGRVREVGEGVGVEAIAGGLGVGQRVAWISALGSYASQVVVPADDDRRLGAKRAAASASGRLHRA